MNFKKCTTLLLAFLMLVSNSGLAFNVHYCGDEIASVSIKTNKKSIVFEENCCGITEEQSNCCNDKLFKIQETSDKFQENKSQIEFNSFIVENQTILISSNKNQNYKYQKTDIFYTFLDNFPAIYKRNCQLIYYA